MDQVSPRFEPTLASVSKHEVPDWYHDAKFGIFIHWSPSSIPAYAPVNKDVAALLKEDGELAMYSQTPYAEWYLNSIQLDGSPAQKYHHQHYGADYNYDQFGKAFDESMKNWQPEAWANLFSEVNAKYVVLVTKHHDGFTLFPSDTPHPTKEHWHTSRDVVGELTEAVRAKDIKMGLYYSGALDWSFYHEPIEDFRSLAIGGSDEQSYIDYVDAQFRELIDKYKPSVLWNDIGYPPKTNLNALFAYYYNKVPEGVVNDRWIQIPSRGRWIFRLGWVKKFISWLILRSKPAEGIEPPAPPHSDYATPEYTVREDISERKWESVRGVGKSFGYNAQETESDFLSREALIHMLIDIVSKNGNLLLNLGPEKDGTIPEVQIDRVRALGQWLDVNGEAIFASKPWLIPSAKTSCGLDVRFTQKDGALFIFILGKPDEEVISILANAQLPEFTSIELLGSDNPVTYTLEGDLAVTATWLDSHAQVLVCKR